MPRRKVATSSYGSSPAPRAAHDRTGDPPDLLTRTPDWRGLFDGETLTRAQKKTIQAEASKYAYWYGFRTASFRSGLSARVTTRIGNAPSGLQDEWARASFSCDCGQGRAGGKCVHMAALLFAWEKKEGPVVARESLYDYQRRKEREAREALRAARAQKKKEMGEAPVPALEAFKDLPRPEGLVFFDVENALRDCTTTAYAISRMEEVREAFEERSRSIEIERDRDGSRWMVLDCSFWDEAGNVVVEGYVERDEILSLDMVQADGDYWPCVNTAVESRTFDPSVPLDEYQLVTMEKAWAYMLADKEAGDQTDGAAKTFFQELEKAARAREDAAAMAAAAPAAPFREEILTLLPRIVIEEGRAKLSFKLGRLGARLFVIRNLRELAGAYRGERKLDLTKKESVDFSGLDMCAASAPLMDFICRRVGEIRSVNEKLDDKYDGRGGQLTVTSSLDLEGSLLDGFYDAAQGQECSFQDKTNGIAETPIRIGHRTLRIRLTAEQLTDARGAFAGVAVSGLIPVMIRGASANYTLNAEGLSRISRKEEEILAPFRKVADASGFFRFAVGIENLQEFYYRVLPSLLDNPNVFLEDQTGGEAQKYLPPEPEFVFYIDFKEGELLCKALVRYEDRQYAMYDNEGKRSGRPSAAYRDQAQEDRVLHAIKRWFPSYNRESKQFQAEVDDDGLYDFLTVGLSQLERYGTCRGTDAFRRQNVRQAPAVQVGVSLESGIMDLAVTAKEVDPAELLEILSSYREKKRYHRLRGGDFVDLSQAEGLSEAVDLLAGLDLAPEQAFGKRIALPAFRALYLDRLLEEHDAIAASRDRTYRALVKNFRSIRDADYEPPQSLEEVLRPYQSYGFKWLRTLEAAGFGGILADEMGLGKTLQMISLLLSDRETEAQSRQGAEAGQPVPHPADAEREALQPAGGKQPGLQPAGDKQPAPQPADAGQAADACGKMPPALVVCPASLVYNWEEEIRRFAPALRCAVLAGSLGARKKLLAQTEEGAWDVYVTSYDTLKRDISLYKGRSFSHCILDEAQFIKNPKAAASKAVKAISAAHRYALTGTPIENRLSELWSIFDFLMPGFLYGAAEFSRRFELPIMKEKDAVATERLRRMTGPFILRRRKEDVLKDLPAKMEEARYIRVEGEQQKLYDAQVLRMKRMLKAGTGTEAADGARFLKDAESAKNRRTVEGAKSGWDAEGTEAAAADLPAAMDFGATTVPAAPRAAKKGAGEERIRIFAELTRIRQICCDPSLVFEDYHGESAKRAAVLELIRSAMDGGHRMLVFSQFTSMLALLEEDLRREEIPFYTITGATPKERRIALVHDFNEGDVPVFLISLKAGGTGLNLTGADVVIHYDPWWNLAVQNQATDRAHRIGQTRQVTVYRLVLKGTVEEKILALQEEKKDLAEAILSGERDSIMSLSNEELLDLLS